MDLLNLCKTFIGLRSCSELQGTQEIVEFLIPQFKRLGARVETQEVGIANKINLNLLARFGDHAPEESPLIINTHLDTVSPGDPTLWTKCQGDPFRASIHGSYLYGIGSADTKLAMACVLTALSELKSEHGLRSWRQPLRIMGSAGEEVGLIGARHALVTGFAKGKFALISEPSELNLVWAHKGLCACIIEIAAREEHVAHGDPFVLISRAFKGRAAHSSTPHLGANALEKALDFLEQQFKKKNSPLIPCGLSGGIATNIIPPHARLYFRIPLEHHKKFLTAHSGFVLESGQNTEPCLPVSALQALLIFRNKLKAATRALAGQKSPEFSPPQATTSLNLATSVTESGSHRPQVHLKLIYDHRFIRRDGGEKFSRIMRDLAASSARKIAGTNLLVHLERLNDPMFGNAKSGFVRDIQVLQRRVGLRGSLKTKSGCTEGGLFSAHGFEAIVVGPGKAENNIHKPNEKVSVAQLRKAVEFYKAAIMQFCL